MVEASKWKPVSVKSASAATQLNRIKDEEDLLGDSGNQHANQVLGIDQVAALENNTVRSDDEEDEGTRAAIKVVSAEHGKEDEVLLRLFYAQTDQCRTSVLDKAFCSPPHAPCISVNGCDNCIWQRIKELETEQNETTHQDLPLVKQEPNDDNKTILSNTSARWEPTADTIPKLQNLLIEPRPKEQPSKLKARAKYRPKDERAILEESLVIWRRSIYLSECKGLGIHANHIICDESLRITLLIHAN
jgi:hypothetical protein